MIHLRDLIEKTKNHAEEITFTDDIVVNSYVKHCMFMTPSRRCAMRAAISRHTNGFWESLNTEEHST